MMQSADLVITLGQAMKGNIVAAGVPKEKIIVAPNAVGGDYLLAPQGTGEARRKLGLEQDAQIIGTVSSLVPYEGLDDLITAFALLAPSNPRLRLLIVGSGVSLPSLEDQARRTAYGDRVIFTGRVPRNQARDYHQALDVFVVPRKNLDVTRSVTPLKPVEALASARPVVASALPALAEIVDDGRTGLLVPPEDPAALAESLASLLCRRPTASGNGTVRPGSSAAHPNMGSQRGGPVSRRTAPQLQNDRGEPASVRKEGKAAGTGSLPAAVRGYAPAVPGGIPAWLPRLLGPAMGLPSVHLL